MLEVTFAAWAATIGLIVALFALDLLVSGRGAHTVGFREAVRWSVFYVGVAIAFGVAFGVIAGWDYGAQYFAGYIVEKSLSVDNLFVFVLIMSTFAVPPEHQQRVLTFGILAALVLRAIFIALGAALLVGVLVHVPDLRAVLLVTAIQLFRHRDQDPRWRTTSSSASRAGSCPSPTASTAAGWSPGSTAAASLTPLFMVLVAIGSTDLAVRARLDPGGVRRDGGGVHRLRGQRLRAARPARAVFPRHRAARPARLPVDRPLADPRVHRRQADAALGAPAGRQRPGDRHVDLAGGDHRRAGGDAVASLVKARRDPGARAHAGSMRDHPPEP